VNHSLGLPPGDDSHGPAVREVVTVCRESPPRTPSRSHGWAAVLGLVATAAIVVFVVQRWATARVRAEATSEARATLQQIRGAEDAYRAEHGEYRPCASVRGFADPESFFPRPLTKVNDEKSDFGMGGDWSLRDCWSALGARSFGPVRASFAVVTGPAGPIVAAAPPGVGAEDWPFNGQTVSADPWFLAVAARIDRDGHRSLSYVVSTESDVGEIPID
jgi:type II secretory pathway pseudopilin PulG